MNKNYCNFAALISRIKIMPDNKKTQPLDNKYAHLQPQAVDIERIVLGALMIDKDAFSVISELLRPETFYEPRNQKVYKAIQTLNIDENPVDIMTVTEELKREGTLEDVGGAAYILELSSRVASSAHIEYHAKILAQKFLARQLISFASVIETKAFDETIDVDELMQEAEGSLFELSQKNMRQDYTQIDPVVKQAIEILQKAAANKGGLTGIPTGYTKLDDYTAGWQRSDLVIIAGRPAMGKTSFALSLAKNIAVDYGRPIAFFSLEMNNVQLVNRLISNVCEIEGRKILNGQLDDEEWSRLDKNVRKLQSSPIYIDDTPGMSIFELRTKARRLVREKGVELINVDNNDTSQKAQLRNLINGCRNFICQEPLQCNSKLSKYNKYPATVNSLRCFTLNLNGMASVISSYLRMSYSNTVKDNVGASVSRKAGEIEEGGAFVGIGSDGTLSSFGLNRNYERIIQSPSGIMLKGEKLDFYDVICDTAKSIHSKLPMLGFIAFDMTIDVEDKVRVIEINLDSQDIEDHHIFNGSVFKSRLPELLDYVIANRPNWY